jgi:ribosomal protein L7Ae-like RNA K-turn-binding protein
MRGCRSKKLKFVIIAPNIDPGGGDGGLDSQVKDVVDAAREAEIPLIFALSRKKIGQALGSVFRPSIVGFVSVENLNGQHVVAMSLASKLRSSWAARKNTSGDNMSSSTIKSTDLGTSRKSTLNVNAEEWVPGGK